MVTVCFSSLGPRVTRAEVTAKVREADVGSEVQG